MTRPCGVVTFLFTDIEGSTKRWEEDPGRMRAALRAHDEVLRGAVTRYGGGVFKHTGDGVCAAFGSPQAAVDAAVDAQRNLELPVRMGISTGEAERRDGDYFGAVLNRAARVMSAGHGGQILLDASTAHLIPGIELRPLGARQLRDITGPVQLFQVRATGLREDFPALRTADRAVGNLRVPPGGLIGRDQEMAQVRAALREHRLVTLTGVGGVGKTRLALAVAASARADFPDGVWVIELASVGDPGAIPDAVAAVLGVTRQPNTSLAESVASASESRTRLLIFDNCEHVVDAAADIIEAILARSDTVKILATSREGLRVSQEQLWPVGPLGFESSAAALFVERAHAVAPAISFANDPVIEICRRLEGIPLAIELAASRLQSMTVTEVRDHLDNRFRLLVGARRGVERHQTLRHAVQWSYDLLSAEEKTLLTRCSVFAGGFDLAGACAIVNADEFTTLDILHALARKSLVVAHRDSERTRFAMLETIRQFAEEQLVAAGQANEARDIHARYFAGREHDVLTLWDSPRQREAYSWFTIEFANLRAAFRWAADSDHLDDAAAIAVYGSFLGSWAVQHEAFAWAEELIDAAKVKDHPRLAQLYVMAALCYDSGRIDDALGYAEAGRSAIESGNYGAIPFEYEASLGGAYLFSGQPEKWVDWCRRMSARYGDEQAYTPAYFALALTISGQVEEAMAVSADLLALADTTDNPHLACYALLAYGFARRDTDPVVALKVLSRGHRIAHESGNRELEPHFVTGLSQIVDAQDVSADTLESLSLAIRGFYEHDSLYHLHTMLATLVGVFDVVGEYESAAFISGFAANPVTKQAVPKIVGAITHLRDVLGDERYDALALAGKSTTLPAIVDYAIEHINRLRALI